MVRVCILRLPCWVLTGVVLIAAAHGQAPPSPVGDANPEKPSTTPAVAASPLDTFLLRDSKGNLVPVLGMTFEEFEQLLRTKKGLAPPAAPDYVLDSLSLVGTADEQTAHLQVTATIRVRSDGWIRVPLELRTAVVRQPPKHEGPGEHFLTFEDAAGGYVCWLKGQDQKPHVVTLQVSVALSTLGEEHRLAIAVPRATESSLRLTTPAPGATATLHEGDGIVSTRDVASSHSEIAVLGPAGDLQLAWRTGQKPLAQQAAQLDANGEILVRVESEQRITSDARLRVRSYGPPLETFRVRLPAGMELVPINLAGYSLTPLAPSSEEVGSPAGRPPAGQLIEVRLDRPTSAATEVRLLATLQADLGPAVRLTPARFEVLGAVRQRGTIDFSVDGEWQLDWTDDRSVRRLDLTPDAASRAVARFEYFRQPCGLQLKVAARPSRISVEPAHSVFVEARQARIKSTFKCRFRGARTSKLAFELGDWQLLRIAPSDLFNMPLGRRDTTGQIEVSVRSDAVLPAEIDVELEAHRALTAAEDRLMLTFPRPVADLVAPASISIALADNIELMPLAGEIVGLSPDASPARTAGRQQPSLVYRDLGSGEPARFAAAMRTRSRLTAASGYASVRLDRRQMHVEQRLEYRVAHESQRSFALVTPQAALVAGNLQVWHDGVPLDISSPTDAPHGVDGLARVEFTLPSEQIGTFQVAVRYAVPLVGWNGQKPLALALPLALPADGESYQFTGQQIEFTLAEGMRIEPDPADVDEFSRPALVNGNGSLPVYSWSRAELLTAWLLTPAQAIQAATVFIERQWVQTWLASGVRQERVAFQLRSPRENIRVRLPKGAAQSSVQAAVDGAEIAKTIRDPGQIVLSLPPAARGRDCVLELFYSLEPPPHRLGLAASKLQPAQIDGAASPRRCYWQLALPASEHLLVPPRGLTAEMKWNADPWLLKHRPALDEQQLQLWVGASRQEPLPRAANLYLFGGLGETPALDILVAQRRLIVAGSSGAVLLLGLLLIHVPRLRSPSLLFVAAVLIAGLVVVAPELAVLAGQSALLGLAIATAAAAWTWLMAGHARPSSASLSTIVARPREVATASPAVARAERSSQITPTAAAIEVRP